MDGGHVEMSLAGYKNDQTLFAFQHFGVKTSSTFLVEQRTLLGAPVLSTRSKKLLGAPVIATRNNVHY